MLAVASFAAPRKGASRSGGNSKAPARAAGSAPKGAAAATSLRSSRTASRRTASGRRGYASSTTGRQPAPAGNRSTRAFTPASPSAERYREIQQALVDKGYYQGPVDGSWNSDTQAAFRRFQTDQKLGSSGKLDSRSLIALGLGPKRDNNAAVIRPAEGPNQ